MCLPAVERPRRNLQLHVDSGLSPAGVMVTDGLNLDPFVRRSILNAGVFMRVVWWLPPSPE